MLEAMRRVYNHCRDVAVAGVVAVHYDQLARELGISRRQASESVNKLAKSGHLVRTDGNARDIHRFAVAPADDRARADLAALCAERGIVGLDRACRYVACRVARYPHAEAARVAGLDAADAAALQDGLLDAGWWLGAS